MTCFTTLTTRLASFAAAALMTVGTVQVVANYALPQTPAAVLASAQR